MALVSILVPMYNVEDYLARCLKSLVKQTYEPIEIILIDDGSTDGTMDIARDYMRRYRNIRLFTYENAGISTARNRALKHATGDYIMFVDSDDYIERNMVQEMMKIMIKQGCDIVVCGFVHEWKYASLYRKVCPKGTMTSLEALHSLVENKGMNNYPWAKLYKRSCFKDVNFPEEVKGFEDTYTVFKSICNASRIGSTPKRFYHYCQRKGSLTNRMDLKTVYDMRRAYEYQAKCLKRWYPEEDWAFDEHYFNSDIMILYTMLTGYDKGDDVHFIPGDINWQRIDPLRKAGYNIVEKVVDMKFKEENK